jgi:hypothetical protein
MRAAALLATLLACAATAPGFAADSAVTTTNLFKRGSQWMALRVGYAKGSGEVAPDGMVGGGFGYRRFVLDGWAFGGFVQYDVLGRFGSAADISVPITLEVTRHTRWGSSLFPYVGVGAGAYYHKYYRTGMDESGFTPGRYLTFGAQTPIRTGGLLGVDIRMAVVDKLDDNPVFAGPERGRYKVDDLLVQLKDKTRQDQLMLFGDDASKTRLLWTVKLDYSINY